MSNEAHKILYVDVEMRELGQGTVFVMDRVDTYKLREYDKYILADIAQAQTNAKVREVLLQILSSVENDSHIDVLVGINKLLNEYPDLLTNEEETA